MSGFCGFIDRIQDLHHFDAVAGRADTFRPVPDTIHIMIDLLTEHIAEVHRRFRLERDIRHIAVQLSVKLKLWIEGSSRLCAEELHFPLVVFDVQAEARLYAEHGTVLKADKCRRQILDVADVILARAG